MSDNNPHFTEMVMCSHLSAEKTRHREVKGLPTGTSCLGAEWGFEAKTSGSRLCAKI